jgi:hypothetical protein
MRIWTVSMSTITKRLSNEGFRLCVCGSEFVIIDHFRKRRPKERVGTAAVCTNPKCEYNHSGFLGYDLADLKKKVNVLTCPTSN